MTTQRVEIDALYARHVPHPDCNLLAEMEYLRLVGVLDDYTLMGGQVTSMQYSWYWLTLQAYGMPYTQEWFWQQATFAGMTLDQVREWREREAERLVAAGHPRAVSARAIFSPEERTEPGVPERPPS